MSEFICNHYPDFSTDLWQLRILFSEYTALSNMPVTQSSRLSGGWVRDKYATTPVMSTYLLAFVVAAFDHREAKQNNGPLVSIHMIFLSKEVIFW